MKKSKKGQVTIFVIIAILVVAGISLFFYVQNKTSSLTPSIPKDIQPVYDFVRSCIEETGYKAVGIAGPLGGYCRIEDYLIGKITYYSINNKSIAPKKEIIEGELSSYIEDNLDQCLNKSWFVEFEIVHGNPKVSADISKEIIDIKLNYPLTIRKEGSTFELNNFGDILLRTRLGWLYDAALNITNTYTKTESFNLIYASEIGDSTGIKFLYRYYPNYTLVYINDEKGIKENLPYAFKFALA
jgi:hypothetical protein